MVLDSDCWDETSENIGKNNNFIGIQLEKFIVSKAVSERVQVIRRWDWKPFTAAGAISRNRQSKELSRAAI